MSYGRAHSGTSLSSTMGRVNDYGSSGVQARAGVTFECTQKHGQYQREHKRERQVGCGVGEVMQ